MNYTHTNADGQMEFSSERCAFLMIPSSLDGFNNSYTTEETTMSGRNMYRFNGCLEDNLERTCSHCGSKMHVNNHIPIRLRQGYGYPDDEYFFLKLIDASRNTYVRNPKSHKILE